MRSDLFIRRPVLTTLLMAAFVLAGIGAYRALPVSDLPNVDFPTIQVSASLPGASPETMASAVATPLERQFTTIAGIDSMTSTSALGLTQITVQFNLGRDIDGAAQDVQAAIAKAANLLPPGMPNAPTYQKVNPADQPIIFLAVSSKTLPMHVVDEYAQTNLAQQLSTISGVAQVNVFGSQKYAVRIQADPGALALRGIGSDELERAIATANPKRPTGTLYGAHQSFSVQTDGQLASAEPFKDVVVAWRNGAPLRLGQVANVVDGVQTDKVASWFTGTRAVVLAVQRQPGTNTVQIVDQIRSLLPKFREVLPAQIDLEVLFDRAVGIRHSVEDVEFTLLLTIALVVMVIFLFLRNLSATLIPSLAVPISILGTFALMWALGYSIDLLSLMALTLCVGFVVDDAVVVLENIVRHMEEGMPRMEAAIKGTREIAFTVISMTISLAAVFIPVLFMGGIVGRLLHEFAVVIAAAVTVSGIVSLTLTPMLCSRFLTPPTNDHGWAYRVIERFFDGLLHVYDVTLRFTLRHKWIADVSLIASLVATVHLFGIIPKGFIPNEDVGFAFGFTEAAQDISFESMKEHQLQVAKVVGEDENVEAYMSSVGAGGPNVVPNTGRIFIRMKPRAERPPIAEVIGQLRKKLSGIPGISVYLQELPTIRLGGTLSKALYQLTLQSTDLEELNKWAPILTDKMRALPDLLDVNSDLQLASPKAVVEVDRDKAAAVGVTVDQVEATLGGAYGSRQASTIYTSTNQYWVISEVDPRYQRDPEQLDSLYVRSTTGKLVPLRSIATVKRSVGPLTVAHLAQLPAVTISFNLKPGVALSQAVEQIATIRAELKAPETLTSTFQGTAQAFQSSLQGQGTLLIVTILVIYLVLGILYESFIHPITILSGLPSGAVGALLALWLFDMELNVYGFVGLIMLVGIVKKNAIMMIDFALDAQRHGMAPEEAIYQGALKRFRPIMMTTMAALLGTLPIALAVGEGTESRQPLGVAVVGGLLLSQVLTLYITPVLYIHMERMRRFVMRGRAPVVVPEMP
jgi:HAE1 family hydrophobic/amphiphilic exporter-1